jgi:sugar phosphate isomerase/epimerase
MNRRQFIFSSLSAALARAARAEPAGLRFGHRQANIIKTPGPAVFDLARRIAGLQGVELQMHFQNTTLWDRNTLLSYKRGSENSGLAVCSLAGVWTGGVSILQPGPATDVLNKSIRAAEALKARVILVTAFEKSAPDMDQESSYGPVVSVLQNVAGTAADAGVTLAMETSLSPAHDRKLIDLVAKPAVKVYYDADNVERFGHKAASVPGYELLGSSRIAQIHLKNEARLLEEPGRVNWTDALKSIRRIGYNGWLVFESTHSGPEQCIEATQKNIAFVRRLLSQA